VRFQKGEPICLVYPVAANAVSDTEVVIRDLADDPDLMEEAYAWKHRRDEFMQRFNAGDQTARKAGWQRDYFLGRRPDGSAPDAQHVNKLRLATPVDLRKKP
jgi:hypothetical protein